MNKEKYLPDITNSKLPPIGGIEGGSIQDQTNSNTPLGAGGSTAKYLREKLGGIPEQAKENLKEFNAIKKRILEALGDEELSVIQLAEKTGMSNHDVVYYLMSLVKFGYVKTGEIDDMDEYFSYKANR